MFKWLVDLWNNWLKDTEELVVENIECVCEEEDMHMHHHHKAHGDILLGFGIHEITISLGGKPCTVFLSVQDPFGVPVCHGGINKLGFTIQDDGFILYADIQSNTCFVEWTCKLL